MHGLGDTTIQRFQAEFGAIRGTVFVVQQVGCMMKMGKRRFVLDRFHRISQGLFAEQSLQLPLQIFQRFDPCSENILVDLLKHPDFGLQRAIELFMALQFSLCEGQFLILVFQLDLFGSLEAILERGHSDLPD